MKNIEIKTDEEIIEFSENMKKDAIEFLKNHQIMEILEENFNKVEILGSFRFNLLYDSPDIDIKVHSQNMQEDSKKAFNIFAKKRLFRKIEYGDFVKFKKRNRPKGFILNLRNTFKEKEWEVEIWFVDDSVIDKQLMYCKKVEEKLNKKNILEILKEKRKRLIAGKDKKTLSSVEIYKKVLGIDI